MTPEMIEHLTKAAHQRAALMGLIVGILNDSDEGKTIADIKDSIAQAFSHMIDLNAVVRDEIELIAMVACRDWVQQQMAIEQAKEILE